MKFILITCIDSGSYNSDEWDRIWPGDGNNGIKKYERDKDVIFVVKGQERFNYAILEDAIDNKNKDEFSNLLEGINAVIELCAIDLSSDKGALLIHYGSGYLEHADFKKTYAEISNLDKNFFNAFDAPINHTSDFIISDYSIGNEDILAALVTAFRDSQNDVNLKKIIDYLKKNISEDIEKGEYQQRIKSLDEIYYMLVPLRFYVDAYLSCKENKNTETEEKIKTLLEKVNNIQCSFPEMQNLFKELSQTQEINRELSEKISNILENCRNFDLTV